MNLVIGIVFVVSDFVMTVFPKVTAKLMGVWLRTGPSSSRLSTTMELQRGVASRFLLRKTAVSPARVAGDISNTSPDVSENNPTPLPLTRVVVPLENSTVKPQVEVGCTDHNHEISERGSDPRDGEDQGFVRGPPMESSTVKPQVEAACMYPRNDMLERGSNPLNGEDQGFVHGTPMKSSTIRPQVSPTHSFLFVLDSYDGMNEAGCMDHNHDIMAKPQVEAGCMDHNHDVLERGSNPRDGEDQGFVHGPPMESFTVKPQVEAGCMDHNDDIVDQGFVRDGDTQWSGNVKQNLERSAVALPVKETIPVKKILTSSKTIRKLTSI